MNVHDSKNEMDAKSHNIEAVSEKDEAMEALKKLNEKQLIPSMCQKVNTPKYLEEYILAFNTTRSGGAWELTRISSDP